MTNPNILPHQPEFVDNQHGNTMVAALEARLAHLAASLAQPPDIDIATGYFNPEGFARIADKLLGVRHVRLMLGAEPVPPPARPERHLGDPRGAGFERKLLRDAWDRTEQGMLRDRNRLAFAPGTDAAVRKMLDFLRSGRMEVRRYTNRFLHGKAFVFRANGVIAGSSNFTAGGLASNLELNLGQYQPHVFGAVEAWFDDLWKDAEPFDLAAVYEARYLEYDPYLLYLRVLLERYGAELEEERPAGGPIPLTRFQNDGIDRALRIIDRYNGVLVADSVGLGKTFLAGELLRRVIEQERRRALLIAPATLRDGTWARFRHRFQLGLEIISFEQLAQDEQLGGNQRTLQSKRDEYSLIVVDEAHALRNPDTERAGALRRLLEGDPPKRLMLMTATPVNNSLWDLYNLITYFAEHDAVFAELGIISLKERFVDASRQDPFSLKPDVLFDVLDSTTVRRTRHFVQKWYPHDTVELRGGDRVSIQFPKPHVASESYDFDDVLPGFFEEVRDVLQPEEGEPTLTMARYWPSKFRRSGESDSRELALVGLLRSGLLKRFESSAHAFAMTLERMIQGHDAFIEALDEGVVLNSEAITQLAETDSDEEWDEILAQGEQLDAADVDVPGLRAAVLADRGLLERLRSRAAGVNPTADPKLKLLVEELVSILARAREATSEQDARNRRKVIVFSYFADTIHWIHDRLLTVLATDHRLSDYRGRMTVVSGDDDGRKSAVYGFVPISSEAPAGYDDDRYDILLTTDVLAEGVNLQQAARIVNYDLPWNPMRLVQRHGRIDRIGSPHKDVFITCIMPARQLEEMLSLEARIRRKLAQAAASVGLDSEVLPGVESVDRFFSDDVAEIRKLLEGDATLFELAGEDPRAHSGEEYRQELRRALQSREQELRALPGGAGSGLRRGSQTGHFFCARIDDRVLLRFIPLDSAKPIERDALSCLRAITCDPETARDLPEDMRVAAYAAWEKARSDILSEWARAADPATMQPAIRPLFRAAAEHLRRFRPPEMLQVEQAQLIEALEAPRSMRDERALRKVYRPDDHAEEQSSREIARFVKERGFQPWRPPEPLPPIEAEDVRLVVWMAVSSA